MKKDGLLLKEIIGGTKMKKAPLAIYVVAHKDFKEKEAYQKGIYSTFNRDINSYLERGMNIPIFFCDSEEIDIDEDSYRQIVVVILIENKLLLDKKKREIIKLTKNKNLHIFSVGLTPHASKLGDYFAEHNMVRASVTDDNLQDRIDTLLFELAHDLSKLLLKKKNLKIFISHAKKDGNDIAMSTKSYIETQTKMSSFYDVNDIQNGKQWKRILAKGVERSVLLVFLTDKYSTREWCKKEILFAKKFHVPIVVVYAVDEGEMRSFPYMGNAPTIALNDITEYKSILFKLLIESIRQIYQEQFINYIMTLHHNKFPYIALTSAPELLTFAYHKKSLPYIYPDPPLGKEELKLFDKKQRVYTALEYWKSQTKLNNRRYNIALSISKSQEVTAHSIGEVLLVDCMTELARYLMVSKQRLLYGGDLGHRNSTNFTQVITELSRAYTKYNHKNPSVRNYAISSRFKNIDDDMWSDLMGIVKLIEVSYNAKSLNISEGKLSDAITTSESLTTMREQMTEELDIRIVAGGKTEDFSGKYPGILEESYLALKAKKPVFLIGGFGGATAKVIEALQGKKTKEFTLCFQLKNNSFNTLYSEYEQIGKTDAFKYKKMLKYLNKVGIAGLNNNLTDQENMRLFESRNVYEIVFLILKGVGKL